MLDKVMTIRLTKEQYDLLIKLSKENATTIQLQLRKMLDDIEKKLSNKE
jgi:hypothetical protein